MRLVKFTSRGEPLHLNPEHVESVQLEHSGFAPTGRTVIRSVNYESYSVDEDLETVVRMLTENENMVDRFLNATNEHTLISACCHAGLRVSGNGTTQWYECKNCNCATGVEQSNEN